MVPILYIEHVWAMTIGSNRLNTSSYVTGKHTLALSICVHLTHHLLFCMLTPFRVKRGADTELEEKKSVHDSETTSPCGEKREIYCSCKTFPVIKFSFVTVSLPSPSPPSPSHLPSPPLPSLGTGPLFFKNPHYSIP